MKPKLILGLALVLGDGLFGCSTSSPNSGLTDLTCKISIPSLKPDSNGKLQAALILKNESSKSIRVCTAVRPMCGVSPNGVFDVTFISGWSFVESFGGVPRREEVCKNIATLKSTENLQLPFLIVVGTNTTLNITAHFSSGTNFVPEKLNCWQGEIFAKTLTVKIEP